MAEESLQYDRSLDEIVFENRNKEYGAYDLRTSYRRLLTKAFLVGTLLFTIAVVAPFIYFKIQQMNKEEVNQEANLVNILEEEEIKEEIKEEEPTPPPPPKEEEKVEIIQNVVPEPTKAPKIETPPPPIQKQLETQTGLVNQEGVKQTSYTPPPVQAPPKAAAVETKPAVNTNEVYASVDQEAEYPGGMGALRAYLGENFDTSVMDGGEGTLKAKLKFVVERDGTVSNVVVTEKSGNRDFDDEAIRVVKKLKKWKPGKLNGENVRSYYSVPFTMLFE